LDAVAAAFIGLKIADTVAQFSNMWSNLSSGAGVIANVADAFKSKLAGAISSFLSSQAPNLKASFDNIKTSAQEASVAEAEVGATAEGEMATGITAGTTEAEASLATMDTAAAGSSTAIGGIGTASLAAAGPLAALGLIATGTFLLIQHGALDTNKTVTTSTGEMVQANQVRYHQLATGMTADANTMNQNVSTAAQQMYKNVVTDMTDMQKEGIAQASTLSTGAENLFATLQANASGDFGKMSNDAYDYLRSVDSYVAQAQATALAHQMGSNSSNVANKNFYAVGTDSALPGWAIVGEKGPELMQLHGGETILPHGVLPSSSTNSNYSGSGGSSTGSIAAAINRLADALNNQQHVLSVDGRVLGQAVTQHMRVGVGLRA